MASHPVPDNDPGYMKSTHGTQVLITDPRSEQLLQKAHIQFLKKKKLIVDAWTI